ncbi:hypothetical protein ABZ863_32680 [Saccharomonospora sp. NPDC046836]|uniref:hypothetical protein n=1 Tax=Saccharomonospora sp. NPDC046836 TaxID=3156921 RepID=UPI00340A395F
MKASRSRAPGWLPEQGGAASAGCPAVPAGWGALRVAGQARAEVGQEAQSDDGVVVRAGLLDQVGPHVALDLRAVDEVVASTVKCCSRRVFCRATAAGRRTDRRRPWRRVSKQIQASTVVVSA